MTTISEIKTAFSDMCAMEGWPLSIAKQLYIQDLDDPEFFDVLFDTPFSAQSSDQQNHRIRMLIEVFLT